MPEDVTVDVEVDVEVDSDELEIERDDAELVEASYEAGGVEIHIEAEVETHGGDDHRAASDSDSEDDDHEGDESDHEGGENDGQ
ncbi:hypothetical protein U4E84_00305 [Halorubrum sp. AD140]|uniref:hypothetical protein n=1 Tax=Halorubrum sp. AD140 TaxID=3050073 RepID=UPI002ACD0DAF|nr:hypothetical protein [Halorubrum sp. AD140]MDZ5809796.1 hypothetical protein [Halorubrum sp. AD140]